MSQDSQDSPPLNIHAPISMISEIRVGGTLAAYYCPKCKAMHQSRFGAKSKLHCFVHKVRNSKKG